MEGGPGRGLCSKLRTATTASGWSEQQKAFGPSAMAAHACGALRGRGRESPQGLGTKGEKTIAELHELIV